MISNNKSRPIAGNLLGVIKTHKLGVQRLWNPSGYKVRFSIDKNGEIRFKTKDNPEETSLGTVREFRNISSQDAINLLSYRFSTFDKLERDINNKPLRAIGFDGSIKLYDSLNEELLESFAADFIPKDFYDPNVIAQFSIRKNEFLRQNTDDVMTVLDTISNENGGYPISYKYFPRIDVLLVKKGISDNPEYATLYKQVPLKMSPKMQIFHHVHSRSLNEPIEDAYDVLEKGCNDLVDKLKELFKDEPSTLDKLEKRVSSLRGTMNWGWDGKYDGYVFVPETHKHPMLQEPYIRANRSAKDLHKFRHEQGFFNGNVWVTAIAKCGDDNLYLIKSPDGIWITRYIASFEEARYADPLSQYYGSPVEYNLKTPSFAGHDFAHLLSSLKHGPDLVDTNKQFATQSRIKALSHSAVTKLASREDQLEEYKLKPSYSKIAGDALAATQRLAEESLSSNDHKAYEAQCERMVGLMVDVIAYHLMPTELKKIPLSFFGGEEGLKDIIKRVFDLV